MDIKGQLQSAGIEPNPLKDQFFLKDKHLLTKFVDLAKVSKKDVVLEIGAGIGNLTRELAKNARKVIAIEIDKRYKPFLEDLPLNVEVRFEDAHKYAAGGGKFRKKKEFNKVVSNIPFSIGEWLLHNLTFVEYDKAILLVAKKFADSTKTNPVFSSFYKVEEKLEVAKDKFYPIPKTDSVVIDLARLPGPIKTRDLALFLRQFIYQREKWKTKSSLREGLITYTRLGFKRKLTKNQAREVLKESGISENLLERQPDNPEIYEEISKKMDEKLLKVYLP